MQTNIVNISGGKDSTAVALLIKERNLENTRYVFADTGNEHPITYKYLDYLETVLDAPVERVIADFTEQLRIKAINIKNVWPSEGISSEEIEEAVSLLKPSGNPFLDLCMYKGRFPSVKARFCTDELKVLPILYKVILPLIDLKHEINAYHGVRADESKSRSKLEPTEYTDPGYTIHRPILTWTAQDVFSFIESKGVKRNKLYDLGMNRVGCMPCIMCRKSELSSIAFKFPEELERIKRWENLVSRVSKKGCSTFFSEADGKGSGIDQVKEWALKGYSESEDETGGGCSSTAGVCE